MPNLVSGLITTCTERICKNLKPLTKESLINFLLNSWYFLLLLKIAKVCLTVLIEYLVLKLDFNQKVV
jgi:hypothetical protein